MRPWRQWRRIGARHVPKTGFLVSGKYGVAFSGGATARGMSPKRGFLFPEKMVWRFEDMVQNAACPKNGVSCLEKKHGWVQRRFSNYRFLTCARFFIVVRRLCRFCLRLVPPPCAPRIGATMNTGYSWGGTSGAGMGGAAGSYPRS